MLPTPTFSSNPNCQILIQLPCCCCFTMGWTIFCGYRISSGDEKWSIFLKGKTFNFPLNSSFHSSPTSPQCRFQNFAEVAFPVWVNNKNNRLNERDQSKFHANTRFDRFAKFSPQFFLWVHFVELVVVIYVRFCFFFDFFALLAPQRLRSVWPFRWYFRYLCSLLTTFLTTEPFAPA